jgi:nucleoside-diphosphate-sugar epimerase
MSPTAAVLVTGATGFIGTALCTALVRRGWKVRAAVRRAGTLKARGVEEQVVGDLSAPITWSTALGGVDAVVHLAALVHQHAVDDNAYHRVNCTATEELATAAAAAGARRLIFLSSIKVNGERTAPATAFKETDAPCPQDAYARSKWAAEEALLRLSRSVPLEVVVLRAPLVYGPGVTANFLKLLKLVERRIPLPLRCIHNRRSLVYVENLVDLLATCAVHPAVAGRTLLASDGRDVSTPELITKISAAMKMRTMLLPFPVGLLRLAGRVTGRSAQIGRLADNLQVDVTQTKQLLSWSPRFTPDEGIAATVAWYLSHGNRREPQP